MKILGIDTSTLDRRASRSSTAIACSARRARRGRGADLLVAIDAACRAAGVAPRELDAVAVGAGPGSFTGLRIGMATAKGIAFAAGRPLWAVSSLAALARGPPGAARRACSTRGAARSTPACYADGDPRRARARDAARRARRVGRATPTLSSATPTIPSSRRSRPRVDARDAVGARGRASSRSRVRASTSSSAGAPSYIRPSEAEVKYPDGVPGARRVR